MSPARLKLAEPAPARPAERAVSLPISVIIAVRNEEKNLPRCLESLRGVGEIHVIDSYSTDASVDIALGYGAKISRFDYQGGWPKKRQWAMETLSLAYDWILLLDADESLTPELMHEIKEAIRNPDVDGYYLRLQMHFLGRELRHSGAQFYKLSLFRTGLGRFECRARDQDSTMCDMEVHEHVVVAGQTAHLRNSLIHNNKESLARYIQKHNEYSNWEARVWQANESCNDLPPTLLGNQAQRRRWLRKLLFWIPGSPTLFFAYRYFFRAGFLDGVPGLIYCAFQGIQFFHIKAKIYELEKVRKQG